MNQTLTVRMSSIVIALAVLVALLVAYVLGTAGGSAPVVQAASSPDAAAQSEPAAQEKRRITMAGAGEINGVPDQLAFKLSVNTKAADVSAALGQANNTMRRVQKALQDEGVPFRDVQTAGLDVRAVYDYSDEGPPVIVGYAVSQDLGVLVRSLEDSRQAITAAVTTGGDAVRLHDLRLQIGDPEALVSKARDAAVADAMGKAKQYADATGQKLGAVVSIKEVSASRPRPVPVYQAESAYLARDMSKVPVRAGTSELKVSVRVTWSFV